MTLQQHDRPDVEPLAHYWVQDTRVLEAVPDLAGAGWLLGWRDISKEQNERTMVPSVLPFTAVGNKFPLVRTADPAWRPLLQAALSSLILDYVLRQRMNGVTLNFYLVKQIACPPPEAFSQTPPWLDEPLGGWVLRRALELTYTSHRIAAYAWDLGDVDGSGRVQEPFRWVPERRFALRAELDAAMLHLYGLGRPRPSMSSIRSLGCVGTSRPYSRRAATGSSEPNVWSSSTTTRWPKPPELASRGGAL